MGQTTGSRNFTYYNTGFNSAIPKLYASGKNLNHEGLDDPMSNTRKSKELKNEKNNETTKREWVKWAMERTKQMSKKEKSNDIDKID